jgi:acetyl-CoA synthetase
MTDLNAQFENYVTVSNPFDYNTSIWGNGAAQKRCFTSAMSGDHDAAFLIYDHPSIDTEEAANEVNEWVVALDAFIAAHKSTGMPAFVVSTISELLPKHMRDHLVANGVIPLQGFEDGLCAYSAATAYYAFREEQSTEGMMPRHFDGSDSEHRRAEVLDEWESKRRLRKFGLTTPVGERTSAIEAAAAADRVGYPVVVKAVGESFLHKSDLGAVTLRLHSAMEVALAVEKMHHTFANHSVGSDEVVVEHFLVEKMVTGAVAELIVGIKRDEQFGPALVIGAGGTLVELITDSASLLLPTTRGAVSEAIDSLLVSRMLSGFRGNPAGDVNALIDTILSIADFADHHWDSLLELDVNPLMVLPEGQGVVAADALICLLSDTKTSH